MRGLDRWLTTDPRSLDEECPVCGDCDWVEVDCHDGGAWECHTVTSRDGEYADGLRTCRAEFGWIHHPEPIVTCDCDEQRSATCEVHGLTSEHRPSDVRACGRFTRHGDHRWLDAHGHLHLCLGGW